MLSFKQFKDGLFEELNDYQKEYASRLPDTDPKIKKDQKKYLEGKDKLHLDLQKNVVPKHIEKLLAEKGIVPTAYEKGKGTDKYGREVKLSKHIKNFHKEGKITDDDLKDYDSTLRHGNKNLGIKLDPSKEAIASQSTGQHWSSCKTIGDCVDSESGVYSDKLKDESRNGSIVAYLHDKDNDPDAKNPIARITIHHHTDENGNSKWFPEQNTYGARHPGFYKTVENHFNKINGNDFFYAKKNPDVYDDDGNLVKINPNASKEQINKALNDKDWHVRITAIRHPNATKENIDKALDDKHWIVRDAAIQHPNATKENIDKALNDENWRVRDAAIWNTNATKEHIDKALNDENSDVRFSAIQHPNVTKKHLDKALNDENEYIRESAKNRLKSNDFK